MERPSHIDIIAHQSLSQRLPLIGLAVSFQIAVFWLIAHGLGGSVIHSIIREIEVPPIKQKVDTGPKPPPINVHLQTRITVPQPDLPPITFKHDPGGITGTPPESPPQTESVVRPPVSIIATHTVPPYQVIARRVGWEGKVILRLTVLADGHVGKAEVVTSSGREDLDQAAQQWIVAHWAYKPALDKGQPAISQTLASVVFSLTDTH